MQKYLLIKADYNDADYVHSFTPINDETLSEFMPLLEAIKNFTPYLSRSASGREYGNQSNFPMRGHRERLGEKSPNEIYAGVVPTDVFSNFAEFYVPHCAEGIHSIVEIKIVNAIE